MPVYNLNWSNPDGPDGEPSYLSTQYRGSTALKAVSNMVRDGHLTDDLTQYTILDWEELDEDGEVADTGSEIVSNE